MFFMTRTLSKSGVWCKPWKPSTNSKTALQRRCIQNQNDCFTILITAPYGIQAFHKEDTYLLTYLICINMYVSMKSISRIFSKINNQNNFFYFFRENKFHEFFHHCQIHYHKINKTLSNFFLFHQGQICHQQTYFSYGFMKQFVHNLKVIVEIRPQFRD